MLALVFVDELCAVTALGVFGWSASPRWLLVWLLPLLGVLAWALFASPRAPYGGPVLRPAREGAGLRRRLARALGRRSRRARGGAPGVLRVNACRAIDPALRRQACRRSRVGTLRRAGRVPARPTSAQAHDPPRPLEPCRVVCPTPSPTAVSGTRPAPGTAPEPCRVVCPTPSPTAVSGTRPTPGTALEPGRVVCPTPSPTAVSGTRPAPGRALDAVAGRVPDPAPPRPQAHDPARATAGGRSPRRAWARSTSSSAASRRPSPPAG